MAHTETPILSCFELNLATPFTHVENVTVHVMPGDWVEIVGAARSGKSTIFQLLSLRTVLPKARIVVKNRNIDRIPYYEIALLRRTLGSCSQNPIFLEDRTVCENLVLPSVARKSIEGALDRAEKLLDEFDLRPIQNVCLKHLSYQDRILVAVVRTFMDDPEILLIDSVFDTISLPYQDKIFDGITQRHEDGTAIVLFANAPTAMNANAKIVQLRAPLIDEPESF